MSKESRATLPELLEFCNQVREAGDGTLLSKLLPSEPGNANECLIAKNLNFGVAVDSVGDDDGNSLWVMHTDDPALVRKIIAKVPGVSHAFTSQADAFDRYNDDELVALYTDEESYDDYDDHGAGPFMIALPARIGQVASDYDRWTNALPGTDVWNDTMEFTPFVTDTRRQRREEWLGLAG